MSVRVALTLGGTDWGRSGIGTYVRAVLPRLAARLAMDGNALVVVGNVRELDAYADVLGDVERVRAPSAADAPALSALWYLARVGNAVRRARADVLLLPAANRRMALWSGLPTVAVVHDLAQLRVARKYDRLRMAYVRRVVVPSLRRATELVAVSRATRDDLATAMGARARRCRVVPNGVDTERFMPRAAMDPLVMRAMEATSLAGSPYVLYAARLEHPGKNHVRLVRAFARARACTTHVLALAGGDWGARALIEEEARRLRISERVCLLGYVPDELMPAVVASADAVAMVGLYEGFGLPALEALACKRPVLAANTGALPEVVGELGAMCDPADERSITAALDLAIEDSALRARCAAEGPAWAAAHSWDKTADGLFEACRAACGR